MGLQTVPAYIGVSGFANPVENDRNILESIFGRTGATRFGQFAVTPTGVARQVSISPGAAVLVGTESATQGAYHVFSDAAETQLFAAAVGNPRIDTLLLRVIDEQYGSDPGDSRAEYEIVQGVAASSPVARADSYFNSGGGAYKPGAWWRLADVRINVVDGILPAGQITQSGRYVRNAVGHHLTVSGDLLSDASSWDLRTDTDTGVTMIKDPVAGWRQMRGGGTTVRTQGSNLTVNNNTTKQDTNLFAYANANRKVVFEGRLVYSSGLNEDASIDFTVPSGTTIEPNGATILSLQSGATSVSDPLYAGALNDPNTATLGGFSATPVTALVRVTFNVGSTAGIIRMRFAQKVAGAGTSAVLYAASDCEFREAWT